MDPDPDFNLWVLLSQTRDAIFRVRQAELSQYGITGIEAFALLILFDLGDTATPAELSRRMFREHNTVTALLSRMQRKGLVRKRRDRERKNVWRIALTDRGRQAYEASVQRDVLHRVLGVLSGDEKREFEQHLRSLRAQALKQLVVEPTLVLP